MVQQGQIEVVEVRKELTEVVEEVREYQQVDDKEYISNTKKNGIKKFKCNYDDCNKSFSLKWIFKRHIDSHFIFKMFKCEICGKAYKSKENLKLHHSNKHLDIKPYKCSFCDKQFSHRNGKIFIKLIIS